jgi:hypothetical protein
MFRKGGPRPWHTKPGGSSLDAKIQEVREQKKGRQDSALDGTKERAEYSGKNVNTV